MNKKSLVSGIIIVIIFSLIGFYSIRKTSPAPQKADTQGMDIWKQTLSSLTANIALSTIDYVIEDDHFALGIYVSDIKNKINGFDYLIIIDKDKKILVHPDTTQILKDYKPEGLQRLGNKNSLIQQINKDGNEIYDVAIPIMLEDIRLGEVHLGLKNPWKETPKVTVPAGSALPKILLLAAAFIGIVISIFGARGTPPVTVETIVPIISQVALENLRKDRTELQSNVKKLKQQINDISKSKAVPTEDENETSKRIATLRMIETKLLKSIDVKKAEINKIEEQKQTISSSVSSTETNKLKEQLDLRFKEISNLKSQLEKMRQQGVPEAATQVAPQSNIDEMKKDELELTQRIVKKRREEITLSQRVETKRKEELALERKIEAIKKKLTGMGS
jgi:hypothetical protein